MSAALGSFLRGSQIGGGRASKAIAKNLEIFGATPEEANTVDPNSLAGITDDAMGKLQGAQKGGKLGLIIKALGGNNQLAGPVGPDFAGEEISPDLQGVTIAQPGALTQGRQNDLEAISNKLKFLQAFKNLNY